MRRRILPVVLLVLAALVAGPATPGRADIRRYAVKVFVDRTQPDHFVPVDDFRVNETISDAGGVRYLVVRGPEGVFEVPFSDIAEVQFLRLRGFMDTDMAMFDARVLGRTPELDRRGIIWLRVMLGVSRGQPWYLRPRTTVDRGARLMRIVFGEGMGQPMPAEPVAEPPAAAVVPPAAVPPAPALQPRPAAAADPFAAMTLDELNASNPLLDVLFDFDKADLRPEAQLTLRKNAEWLNAHPTTRVTIEGYADPRGTNEYNLALGARRAEATLRFLVANGVAPERMSVVSRGRTQSFCAEPSEVCWAQNRRSHFVFVTK